MVIPEAVQFVLALFFSATQVFIGQSQQDSELLPIEVNHQWGFIDKKGVLVIKPQFTMVGLFAEGLAPAGKGNKGGYINKQGEFIIAPLFDSAAEFSQGLAVVRMGDHTTNKNYIPGKYGLIDKTGKMIVAPKFDAIGDFSEGLALVKMRGKWGFINRSGEIVIKPIFSNAYEFSEGLALVWIDKKAGYINSSGQFVIKPQFQNGRSFSEGLARVRYKQYGNWGYIDKTGKLAIEPQFVDAGNFSEGVAWVNGPACINRDGQKIDLVKCQRFSEGLTPLKMNGKWGYVDRSGIVVIAPQWDYVTPFSGGIAVTINFDKGWLGGFHIPGRVDIYDATGQWQYIDVTGKVIWVSEKPK